MGSKAAIVVFSEANPKGVFRGSPEIDFGKSKTLAENFLGTVLCESGLIPLDIALWPDVGIICSASLPGFDFICSRELARNRPSELTGQISWLAGGRNAYGVFMHSAEDWAAFAIWSRGDLVRALSMSPNFGIVEDFGERLPFEAPFWEGEFPVFHEPSYAFPFHPIDLGNEALREFFGFILEGYEDGSCVDPEEIEIPAFRVAS